MNPTPLRDVDAHDAYINRELSWLSFASRVLELAEDETQPLLERVKFSGIMGMILDEFVMKRMGGLHQKHRTRPDKISYDGLKARDEMTLCWAELQRQVKTLDNLFEDRLKPALTAEGILFPAYDELSGNDRDFLSRHFQESVLPILTPLAVDASHPFPFISNLSFNLAIVVTQEDERSHFRSEEHTSELQSH